MEHDADSEHGVTSTSDDDRPEMSVWTQAGLVGALGFEIVAFTVVGVWLGTRLDETYDIAPVGSLLGLFLGLVAVGIHIWHVVKRLLDSTEASDDQ